MPLHLRKESDSLPIRACYYRALQPARVADTAGMSSGEPSANQARERLALLLKVFLPQTTLRPDCALMTKIAGRFVRW